MNAQKILFITLVVSFAAGLNLCRGEKARLSGEDAKYLNKLLKDFLFDPAGAERVSVKVIVRSVWGSASEVPTDGWYVPGKNGKPGRVYFTDGASIAAPAEDAREKVDFVAKCKARYSDKKPAKEEDVFGRMRRNAVGAVEGDDLAIAAWLHRLGHDDLVAKDSGNAIRN
jgi:hypothetical protein